MIMRNKEGGGAPKGACRPLSAPHIQTSPSECAPQTSINIRNQCVEAHTPFFFKQWGGRTPKTGGRLLEGKEWSQFPVLRQVPNQLELQAAM
jgi:hypothetical protein